MGESKELVTTPDINTNNYIRRTDNSLKEADFEPPQHARPLTKSEVLKHLSNIKGVVK